jgi:hypothetical protein
VVKLVVAQAPSAFACDAAVPNDSTATTALGIILFDRFIMLLLRFVKQFLPWITPYVSGG